MSSPTNIQALTPILNTGETTSNNTSTHTSPTLLNSHRPLSLDTNKHIQLPNPAKSMMTSDTDTIPPPVTGTESSEVSPVSRKRSREPITDESKTNTDQPEPKLQRTRGVHHVTHAEEPTDEDDEESEPSHHTTTDPTDDSRVTLPRERRLKSLSQLVVLKNFYALHPRVSKDQVRKLITQTGLTHREVTRWFRNERHKEKKLKAVPQGGHVFPHIPVTPAQQAALIENERKRGETYGMKSEDKTNSSALQQMQMPMFNMAQMQAMQQQMQMNGGGQNQFYRGMGGMNMNPAAMGMNMGMAQPNGYGFTQNFMPTIPMMAPTNYMPNGMSGMNGMNGGTASAYSAQAAAAQFQSPIAQQQFQTAMQATTNMLLQTNPSAAPYFPAAYGMTTGYPHSYSPTQMMAPGTMASSGMTPSPSMLQQFPGTQLPVMQQQQQQQQPTQQTQQQPVSPTPVSTNSPPQ